MHIAGSSHLQSNSTVRFNLTTLSDWPKANSCFFSRNARARARARLVWSGMDHKECCQVELHGATCGLFAVWGYRISRHDILSNIG